MSGFQNWHNEGWLYYWGTSEAMRFRRELSEYTASMESGLFPASPLPYQSSMIKFFQYFSYVWVYSSNVPNNWRILATPIDVGILPDISDCHAVLPVACQAFSGRDNLLTTPSKLSGLTRTGLLSNA